MKPVLYCNSTNDDARCEKKEGHTDDHEEAGYIWANKKVKKDRAFVNLKKISDNDLQKEIERRKLERDKPKI